MAKIASQLAKPDGLMVVTPGDERAFLEPLDVEMLSGIGPKTGSLLKGHGIATLGDLAGTDEPWMIQTLGRRGPDLKGRAMGIDNSAVEPHRETKSVSAETTMARDVDDEGVLTNGLRRLSEGVSARLRRSQLMGRTVTLRLRLSDFTTFTRQRTLPEPTDSQEVIFNVAQELLIVELTPGRRFRLIGVGVTNFPRSQQLPLLTL